MYIIRVDNLHRGQRSEATRTGFKKIERVTMKDN